MVEGCTSLMFRSPNEGKAWSGDGAGARPPPSWSPQTPERGLLFYRLLEQAVNTDPHPLTELIHGKPGK